MSEAPSSAAWKMTELTRRTSGASEIPSSTSRSSASSSSSPMKPSSTAARAPNASEARTRRRISTRMSSREATESSIWWRVASRSSSIALMLPGSAIATLSVSSTRAYGIAPTRSRTWSGISFAASSSTFVASRSASGMLYRAARVRAIPSAEATPSSMIACAIEPCAARPRTSASLSAGIRPVAASRSVTSSVSGLIWNGARRPAARARPRPDLRCRRCVGWEADRSRSYPSFELSARAARCLTAGAVRGEVIRSPLPSPPRGEAHTLERGS